MLLLWSLPRRQSDSHGWAGNRWYKKRCRTRLSSATPIPAKRILSNPSGIRFLHRFAELPPGLVETSRLTGIQLAQLETLDLPRGRLRQRVEYLNPPGVLIRREPLL